MWSSGRVGTTESGSSVSALRCIALQVCPSIEEVAAEYAFVGKRGLEES